MGAAGLVAALAGRPASRVYALGLAAAVTLALNPYAAGDAGWQLSFAAVVGLLRCRARSSGLAARRRVPAAARRGRGADRRRDASRRRRCWRRTSAALARRAARRTCSSPRWWRRSCGSGCLPRRRPSSAPALAAPFTRCRRAAGRVRRRRREVARAALPHATVDGGAAGHASVPSPATALAVAWLGVALAPRWLARPARGDPGRRAARLAAADARRLGRDRGRRWCPFSTWGRATRRWSSATAWPCCSTPGRRVGRSSRGCVQVGRRAPRRAGAHPRAGRPRGCGARGDRRFRPRLSLNGGAGWPTPVQRAPPADGRPARFARWPATRCALGPLELDVLSPPSAGPPTGDPNNTRARGPPAQRRLRPAAARRRRDRRHRRARARPGSRR